MLVSTGKWVSCRVKPSDSAAHDVFGYSGAMTDENECDDPEAERLQALWKSAGKGEHSNWQRLTVMLLTMRSRKREEQERAARPVAVALLKDLQALYARATRIRETLARIDEDRQAKEAAQVQPENTFHQVVEHIGLFLFPETTPVERFAQQSRAALDTAFASVAEQAAQAIASLKAQFEALSLTHTTKNRGFLLRLKFYQSLGFSESEMAEIEKTTAGKIHQGRRRMADVRFPFEDADEEP